MNLRWAAARHPADAEEKNVSKGLASAKRLLLVSISFCDSRIRAFLSAGFTECFIPISFSLLAPVKQAGEGSRAPCQWLPGPKDSSV